MPQRQTAYSDELLADGSVHRRYSDGRQEWRTRGPAGVVFWRDDRGDSGTDEPLGRSLVKRTYTNGRVLYGRESGYGRTLWSDGVLTLNRSSFGGRVGAILAGVFGGTLVGSLAVPPDSLTEAQEEELRSQGAPQSFSDGATGEYENWDGDDNGDDDFG